MINTDKEIDNMRYIIYNTFYRNLCRKVYNFLYFLYKILYSKMVTLFLNIALVVLLIN